MRWLERARGPPSPTVGTQAESKAEVSDSRAESRRLQRGVQERGVLCARISMWSSKCRDQFPFDRELGQKRKLLIVCVCGLARSVIRCFLGSGVLTSRRPLYPECCDLVLIYGIPPDFRGGIHLHAIGSVPSLSGHAIIAYRWRSLPRVLWHRVRRPQGSSSYGSCLGIIINLLLMCASLSRHPLLLVC